MASLPARRRLELPAEAPFLAALAALALALGLAPITNNDVWLHLLTGDWMLAEGRVPAGEVFSFVAAGRPYVAHEWGSEILLSACYHLAGVTGLVAFKTLVALLLALGLYAAARALGAAPAPAAATVGAAITVAGAHLWARPHLLTWLALGALLALLHAARRRPRLLLVLPALQVAWTNVHGAFVLGPAVAAAWGIGEIWSRADGRRESRPWPVLAAAGAMALACLANPYGMTLLHLPFELTRSEPFMQAVYEWQPPLTSPYVGTTMFALFTVLVLLAIRALAAPAARQDRSWLLVLGLLLALALRMNRNVPIFALAAAPWLAAHLPLPAPRTRLRPGRALVVAALAGTATLVATAGYPYGPGSWRPVGLGVGPRTPVAACDTLDRLGVRGRAFTTYGEGAYVAWRLWPRVTVGMDSRNSVYGEELYRAYREALASSEGMRAWLARWPVDLAVTAHDGPFRRGPQPLTGIDADQPHDGLMSAGGLLLVDFDDHTAAYAAPAAGAPGRVAAAAYRVLHPVLMPSPLPPALRPRALAEARRAVAAHPDSVTARWLRASVAAQLGRDGEALEQLAMMGRLDLAGVGQSWGLAGTVDAARLGLTGLLLARQGRCSEAREALLEALRRDRSYRPARDMLAGLDC